MQEKELNSVLRILSLLYRNATKDEILLLVKVIVAFCNRKGIVISKGRSRGENRVVTIPMELY